MQRAVVTIIAEGSFIFAFAMAKFGMRFLPKDHPIRHYHKYAQESIKPLFVDAARAERQK